MSLLSKDLLIKIIRVPLNFRPFAVAALAVAVALGGCGDSGASATSATTISAPLSKPQFIKQADAICNRVDVKQLAGWRKYLEQHPNFRADLKGQIKEIMVVELPPVRSAISEISELPAPKGDEKRIAAIIAELEGAVSRVEKEPSTLLEPAERSPFADVNERAASYGFEVCSIIA